MLNKIKTKFFTGIFCSALAFNLSYSQPLQLRFENYTRRDGLSADFCRDIFQDSRGFIWVATQNGLNRFDGISFQNFYHNPSDTNSLSGNIIRSMTELPNSLLVIGTNNGLCVYNILKNRFENHRIKQKELSYGNNSFIRKTFCDADKNLWVNHNGVIDVFDSLLNYKFRFTDSAQGKILRDIVIDFNYPVLDVQNNLWIPSNNMGIVTVDRNSWRVTCYKNSSDSLFFVAPISGFYLDELKKSVWFSPWGSGLWNYNFITKKLSKHIFLASDKSFATLYNTFNGIIPFRDKLLCGSGMGGLFEFNPADGSYKTHTHDVYDASSISSNEIDRMFMDRNGSLWISTYDGLSKAALTHTPFHFYSEQFRSNMNEPFPQLLSFALVDSTWLLVGTEKNGMYALNKITGEVKHCFNKNPLHENENVIVRLYVDRNKAIWIGTFDGFFIYNIQKNILTNPTGIFSALPKEEVTAIHQDSYGDYWFAFRRKILLVHYVSKENKLSKYLAGSENKPGEKIFPAPVVSRIREEKNGNILLSTVGEQWFVLWNRTENSMTGFPKPESEQKKPSEWISDLLPDSGNSTWLSSYNGHGLMHYDYNTDHVKSYSRQEGLCNEIVKSLSRDANGNLWLGTQNGLARFNPVQKTFINFDATDGLPDNEFTRTSFFDSASNLIYLMTPHAVVYFNPDDLKGNSIAQNLYIQKIQINGKDTAVDLSRPLKLSYNHNYIGIEYTSVNFKNGSNTRFAYLLGGLDKQWHEAGSNRFASYSNLAPGNYVFRLKASVGNNDSNEISALTFSILPPFWKTWWFRLLLLFFIISCIYWIVVRRVRLIRKEEKQKTIFNKQLAEVEMKALRAQMNPHFIFNTLNSVNSYILNNDKLKASQYLNRFSKLIRLILESSENQSIALDKEIEMLDAYMQLEQNRFKSKFEYKIICDDKITQHQCEIPSMIIQPYIENAIWHGLMHNDKEGLLKINFSKNENGVVCTIDDNGIGRAHAKKIKEENELPDQGLGIKITRERLQALNNLYNYNSSIVIKDKYNETGNPEGTKVIIHLPLIE